MNRSVGIALAAVGLASLAMFSCPGPAPTPGPSDSGPDASSDAGVDGGPDAGPDAGPSPDAGPDAGPVVDAGTDAGVVDAGPYVTVLDQSLALTTQVTVAAAQSRGPGLVVISDIALDGGPGAPSGYLALNGMRSNLLVALDAGERAANGERFFAQLFVDNAPVGVLDPSDVPALSDDGGILGASFVATVAAGTPDLAFTMNPTYPTWTWSNATPTAYASDFDTGTNPTIRLRKGWRYRVTNPGASGHPGELITQGHSGVPDAVLLSQPSSGTTGSLATDSTINWTTSGNDFTFTASATLQAAMDGYRCGVHTNLMRGDAGFF